MDKVEVTQADRKAFEQSNMEWALGDENIGAEIIARHRIAALEAATATDKARIAELKEALWNIHRKACPDPERTMSEASNDLYWCACEARKALGEKP